MVTVGLGRGSAGAARASSSPTCSSATSACRARTATSSSARAPASGQRMPAVALTAFARSEDRTRALLRRLPGAPGEAGRAGRAARNHRLADRPHRDLGADSHLVGPLYFAPRKQTTRCPSGVISIRGQLKIRRLNSVSVRLRPRAPPHYPCIVASVLSNRRSQPDAAQRFPFRASGRADRAGAARGAAREPVARARRRHGAIDGSACSPTCRSSCAPATCSCSTTRACCRRASSARKPTGGRVESCSSACSGRAARSCTAREPQAAAGQEIELPGGARARVGARAASSSRSSSTATSCRIPRSTRSTPLPPYIARAPEAADRERYQTVFARTPGAVAAPTAGLHFDAAMLEALRRAASSARS